MLVEGPPDMMATRSLGLAAISVPGTNSWQPSWARLLHGRHVKIVMDCDAARRRAAEQIHASLRAAAVTSEIVDLWPDRDDGYDLTDRIVEGKRQRPGRMTAAAVASLLASPTRLQQAAAYAGPRNPADASSDLLEYDREAMSRRP